ncbi:MAG TPA: YggS family pyridoxal phosphate-dependent enzyme [Segetibacter sp.]|nr:YggS family pyridoxal phosphate-dependent enzyme [Segetibacter sp.]
MAVNEQIFKEVVADLTAKNVELVAVSKIQSAADIKKLYDLGQRDFGENYVQELVEKEPLLPKDVRWHFIGHLQSNKVKFIAPFVCLIQGVDSMKLLREINKQAKKSARVIHCLLQVHIAQEETKFGLDETELNEIVVALETEKQDFSHIYVEGLMGMASFSDDLQKVKREMKYLKSLFDRYQHLDINNCKMSTLSMGMSGDYKIAIEEGSNMVRIGSLLFGARSLK